MEATFAALGRSWDALGALLGRSWEALERSRALLLVKNRVCSTKITPRELRRVILCDLGSILSRFLTIFY